IRLVEGPVPEAWLAGDEPRLDALALAPRPLATAADLVAYAATDQTGWPVHRLRLPPAGVGRLPPAPPPEGAPVVPAARGEPVYLGVFQRERPGRPNGVPTILVDPDRASSDCLYDWYWINRNHPHRVCGAPDQRNDPRVLAALRDLGLLRPLDDDAWRRRL